MIDQIKQIIEQVSSKELNGAAGISSNLAGQVTQETGNSILSGLKDSLAQGNIGQLTDLFKATGGSSLTSNPVVSGMITNLISGLTGKVGIDSGTATSFAGSVIPKIVESLISKSKDGTSGFQLTDLIGSLSGGAAGSSLLDSIGGGLGLDKNKDGKIGLDDATSFLKGLF